MNRSSARGTAIYDDAPNVQPLDHRLNDIADFHLVNTMGGCGPDIHAG
jgi:hypothetical protein